MELLIIIFFQVMIFLIDHVLPDSYFANNLRALSVDMAVFRELLHFKMPELAQHLDKLQKSNNDGLPGGWEVEVAGAGEGREGWRD